MSVSTTSIDSLPTSEVISEGSQQPPQMDNVKIQNPLQAIQEERDRESGIYRTGPPTGSANEAQELISSLQQASTAGLTALPSRDIPRDTNRVHIDQETRPNYVPEVKDYIGEHHMELERRQQAAQAKNDKVSSSIETTVNTFETPLILAVLFFLFQLPVVKATFLKILPQMFLEDGNYNLGGLIFSSMAYAGSFYAISQLLSMATNL